MSDISPISAVVTTLSIIEAMSEADGPVGVSNLARATGVTKPRIYRHLRTLLDSGYVAQDPDTEKYALTLRLFHIGQAIAEKVEFLVEARRAMTALRDRAGQTVTIGQVEEDGVRVVDILRHRSAFEITATPGALFDFHSSAQGKLALAFGPDRLLQSLEGTELKRWTKKTKTNLADLKMEVDQIRQSGWAVAPEEALIGINALAAPVFDGTGDLAGTITLVGSVQFIEAQPEPDQIAAVCEAARQVSAQLGFKESVAR